MKLSAGIHRSQSLRLPLIIFLLGAACATATPIELTNARVAYTRASMGPAAQLTPTDLHKAKSALDNAEATFADEHGSQKTVDLAYIAERTAEIAEARAVVALAEQNLAKAKQDYIDKQGMLVKKAEGALVKTREQLTEAKRGQEEEAQQAGLERAARNEADVKAAASEQKAALSEQKAAEAEQKAAEANDALAKLAAKEEERGLVITLSGSVLFRSNDAALLPEAQTRLDQVAAALITKDRAVVIEGYTDSKGTVSRNLDLSQRRAESVRSYLISRGFPAEKIQAKGMGADRPIADNASTEGRANNRRVEIVIAKSTPVAN